MVTTEQNSTVEDRSIHRDSHYRGGLSLQVVFLGDVMIVHRSIRDAGKPTEYRMALSRVELAVIAAVLQDLRDSVATLSPAAVSRMSAQHIMLAFTVRDILSEMDNPKVVP